MISRIPSGFAAAVQHYMYTFHSLQSVRPSVVLSSEIIIKRISNEKNEFICNCCIQNPVQVGHDFGFSLPNRSIILYRLMYTVKLLLLRQTRVSFNSHVKCPRGISANILAISWNLLKSTGPPAVKSTRIVRDLSTNR